MNNKGFIEHKEGNFFYAMPFVIVFLVASILFYSQVNLQRPGSQFFAGSVRLIILGPAYLLALVCVLTQLKYSVNFIIRHWIYFLFLIYILGSAMWSSYPGKVFITWGHYAGFTLVVLSAVYYFKSRPLNFFYILLLNTAAVIILSILVALTIPDRGISPISGSWVGVTSNPNHLGLICVIAVWANLSVWYLTKHKKIRLLNILLLVLTVIALVCSRSVTSMLVASYIAFALPVFMNTQNDTITKRLLKTFFFAVICISAILFIYALKPEWLSISSVLTGLGKEKTLTGRTVLWETGFNLFHMKPYCGWGFDALTSIVPQSRIKVGQFHNGYLDLAIRGGIIALLFLAGIVFKLGLALVKAAKDNYKLAITCGVMVIGILVHNITEASLIRGTHQFWLLFLFIYFFLEDYQMHKKYAENNSHS